MYVGFEIVPKEVLQDTPVIHGLVRMQNLSC